MTRTWWVAREIDTGNYLLGTTKKTCLEQDKSDEPLYPKVFSVRQWHRASTFRLKPGDGPIKVTLDLKVRRVR